MGAGGDCESSVKVRDLARTLETAERQTSPRIPAQSGKEDSFGSQQKSSSYGKKDNGGLEKKSAALRKSSSLRAAKASVDGGEKEVETKKLQRAQSLRRSRTGAKDSETSRETAISDSRQESVKSVEVESFESIVTDHSFDRAEKSDGGRSLQRASSFREGSLGPDSDEHSSVRLQRSHSFKNGRSGTRASIKPSSYLNYPRNDGSETERKTLSKGSTISSIDFGKEGKFESDHSGDSRQKTFSANNQSRADKSCPRCKVLERSTANLKEVIKKQNEQLATKSYELHARGRSTAISKKKGGFSSWLSGSKQSELELLRQEVEKLRAVNAYLFSELEMASRRGP